MDAPSEDRSIDADEIRISLPALFRYGRVARLAVTGLASRNGYSYDDVEDLRIAIGELFGLLVDAEVADQRLRLTCRLEPDRLEIDATRDPAAPVVRITDLSRQILEAVVDDAVIDADRGRIQITKRLRERP